MIQSTEKKWNSKKNNAPNMLTVGVEMGRQYEAEQ